MSSSDQKSDVPGGYFVGRPTTHAADKTGGEPPHAAAGEQNPATAQATKQSAPSFLAKCCPCLAGGGAAE